MADILPGKIVVLTRDQLKNLFKRDLTIRASMQGATLPDTRPGSQADLDAGVFADAATSILANAVAIANGISRATATGTRLDKWGTLLSLPRQTAVGASGAVVAITGTSGASIQQGDRLIEPNGNTQYQVDTSATYSNGDLIPISGVDTGAATNLPPGTVLEWVSPRPGCGSTATVAQQTDGSGLSGGAPDEKDNDYRARLDAKASNPPASGNDAEYQTVSGSSPQVAVQQVFTYPAIKGPGSIGVTFTLRPSTTGANRIPNSTLLSLVNVLLSGVMPASDGIYMCAISASPVTVVLKTIWAQGAAGWADATPWPPYYASPNLVQATANSAGVLSPTAFRLSSSSLTVAPQVGQSVAFFDLANQAFRRKQILSVTAVNATNYDITVDTTQGVSDTGYTPLSGQPCCPWSDSLDTLTSPVLAYFDTLGPGEQVASFFDPGLRQKRSPASPQFWPSVFNNRVLGGQAVPVPPQGTQQNQPAIPTLLTTKSIADVTLTEPVPPYSTPVGSPGVSSNMLTLKYLLAFPE